MSCNCSAALYTANTTTTSYTPGTAGITATSWLPIGGYGLAAMYAPKATSDPQYMELEFTNTMSRYGSIRVHC